MLIAEDREQETARMFRALGDPTRVRILNFLRSRCSDVGVGENGEVCPVVGPSFGEVCCHLTGAEKITSTISFHLNELRDAGLITVTKRGRYMVCGVNREAIHRLAGYLLQEPVPSEPDCAADC